jgi:flagellar L-ring protein precursor FlgH
MIEATRIRATKAARRCKKLLVGAAAAICLAGATNRVWGQDASLLQMSLAGPGQPLTLSNSSFMYRMLPPDAEQRELRINDIITVLVDYSAATASNGNTDNRKQSHLNADLKNWLKFDGRNLMPAPMNNGELKVNGNTDSETRIDAMLLSKDSVTFRIAATIVDIQPNGNLVIEAHRYIHINDEVWQQSLTGIVRRTSIAPDRSVRSDEVADLRVDKKEMGFIRDAYQRGWAQEWWDRYKPF